MTAKYAELLTRFLEMKHGSSMGINIAREIEGMESDSFQHTIKLFNKHTSSIRQYDVFTMYLDIHFPSPRPNLYVIQGDDENSRIKKIPLSLGLQWLMNRSMCLIFEAEYKVQHMRPINYYCGEDSSLKTVKKSLFFGERFYAYFTNSLMGSSHIIENDRYLTYGHFTNDFKQLLEVLEDSRFYNPNEVDYSNDHLKNAADFVIHRDEEISLFEVTSDGLEENPTKPIHSFIFQGDSMGYLLDTKSIAGVFLQLGDSNNIKPGYMHKTNKKPTAIQLAEEYMDRIYPLSSGQKIKMRILPKQMYRSIIDFELNFTD